ADDEVGDVTGGEHGRLLLVPVGRHLLPLDRDAGGLLDLIDPRHVAHGTGERVLEHEDPDGPVTPAAAAVVPATAAGGERQRTRGHGGQRGESAPSVLSCSGHDSSSSPGRGRSAARSRRLATTPAWRSCLGCPTARTG